MVTLTNGIQIISKPVETPAFRMAKDTTRAARGTVHDRPIGAYYDLSRFEVGALVIIPQGEHPLRCQWEVYEVLENPDYMPHEAPEVAIDALARSRGIIAR